MGKHVVYILYTKNYFCVQEISEISASITVQGRISWKKYVSILGLVRDCVWGKRPQSDMVEQTHMLTIPIDPSQ